MASLGQPVQLLTQLSDDPLGRQLLGQLNGSQVPLAHGSLLDNAYTSTARTTVSADGQAHYTFDITWQSFGPSAPVMSGAVTCVHTGSLATALEPGARDVAAIVRQARRTSLISFDPNCRPTLTPDAATIRERVEELAAESDIIKASHEDLAWLYPGQSFADIARRWV